MKKIAAMALAILMTMGTLSGCGNGDNTSSSGGDQSGTPQNRLEKIQQSGKIVLVTSPDYAPYEFIDLSRMGQGDEQYVGADIALARYIADKMGVKLVIEPMDYDAVLTAVSEGKCDMAISGVVAKPDRREKMDFSISYNPPKNDETQSLIIRREDAEKFQSVEDFNNSQIKLAVQNASLQQSLASELMPNAKQVPITKLSDGVMELQQGKIDALVISTTTGEGYANSYDTLVMSGIFLRSENEGTAVAVPKGETELVAKLDEIIREVVDQGLYTQWEEEYQELAAKQQDDAKR